MPAPKQAGVYKIVCLPTGKLYIGSSIDIVARMAKHRYRLREGTHSNAHLLAAWRLYGSDAFTFEIVEATDPEVRQIRERFWMDTYRSLDRERGFNIRDETAPLKQSAESRAKQSATVRGQKRSAKWIASIKRSLNTTESRAKRSAASRGRKMSDANRALLSQRSRNHVVSPETRAKLRAANLGKKLSPEGLSKLQDGLRDKRHEWEERRIAATVAASTKDWVCTDPDGVEHRISNLNAFCREHRLEPSNMQAVARGARPMHRGWTCRHAESKAS